MRLSSSSCAARVTWSTARKNAASFVMDGLVEPLTLRTNCSAAAWISSSVAGGSKLCSVLMLRHGACLRYAGLSRQIGATIRYANPPQP